MLVSNQQKYGSFMHEIQASDLPRPHNRIAEIIGIEKTLELSSLLGGSMVYFPIHAHVTRKLRNLSIQRDFESGMSQKELAHKYRLSAGWVWVILREFRKQENNREMNERSHVKP
ncbi:Mor transcription activator family protein [Paenibacillus validus]|uniref:Mor transcription activator domain-containing protein n=1 Tax=Paenibacillus validus TaxID=44253 RepID=A0A7X3CTE4_9BACL|nr:Mor transcription activator family protein [Paenibacillus validus]MUG72730.1 hypothetical protein [Paenibacillus validus]